MKQGQKSKLVQLWLKPLITPSQCQLICERNSADRNEKRSGSLGESDVTRTCSYLAEGPDALQLQTRDAARFSSDTSFAGECALITMSKCQSAVRETVEVN